jgi:hypothetical protein
MKDPKTPGDAENRGFLREAHPLILAGDFSLITAEFRRIQRSANVLRGLG